MPGYRALKFNVTNHRPDLISPGYWFVAPYWGLDVVIPMHEYKPCQMGPQIFDAQGHLVWTGACLFAEGSRNFFDFRVVDNIDDNQYLSFIMSRGPDIKHDRGAGMILNNKYELQSLANVTNDLDEFNAHEFNVLDGGQTALACFDRGHHINLTDLGRPDEPSWVATGGMEEVDVKTGAVVFEWDALDHVAVSESTYINETAKAAKHPRGLDMFHANSVAKTQHGNYLVSARFTSTIYLISARTGDIIWRLGGKRSDFQLLDFTFSFQHNARIVSEIGSQMVLSFLDNGSDDTTNQEDTSSGLIVELDLIAKTAKLLNRYAHPDGGLTRKRGNVQVLPNGNVFVGWSETAYQSEFAPDGTLLMEARFVSSRLDTYRSYKYPFKGDPQQPPALVSKLQSSSDMQDHMTTIFVSWNGATEVVAWRFYAHANGTQAAMSVPIGNATKNGFETTFTLSGYFDWIFAEALDIDSVVLGRSSVQQTRTPEWWPAMNETSRPRPTDPMIAQEPELEMEQEVGENSSAVVLSFDLFLEVMVAAMSSGLVLMGLYRIVVPWLRRRGYRPLLSEESKEI